MGGMVCRKKHINNIVDSGTFDLLIPIMKIANGSYKNSFRNMLSDFVFHSSFNCAANERLLECFTRIGLLDENRDLLTDSGEHLDFILQNASKIRQNARKVKKMAPSRDMSKFDP